MIEIKNAHDRNIINFRHHLDIINKRDLIISISSDDNDLKLWDVVKWELLVHISHVNINGYLDSSCLLNNNNNLYIITCNENIECEPIKVF